MTGIVGKPTSRCVGSLAGGTVSVTSADRAGANQNPDIGDRNTSRVHENDVGGSEIQWLENDRAVLVHIDDRGIADQHRCVRRGTGRLPLDILVMPIKPETAILHLPWSRARHPAAVLIVSDPETEMRARVEGLSERFGFTPAKTAFALEIIKGDGRQAAADRLGITVGPRAAHLSKIFDKTGATRQAELVRLLLQK
jgi:DNA-binding CsgD family transcriptional regulator